VERGVIVATEFIPAGFDGITVWPFVFVRPARRADQPFIEHELVHYREMAWWSPVWWLLYLLVPAFRQATEVRAYRRQIALGGIAPATVAFYLSDRYRLDLSYASAMRLLS
jgi:hypothetical protein